MTTYICKCGRQVKKATNADNTGNRDTEGCKGCPYLLPWGPDKYIEGQGYTKDVQGYECRMSPTISYTTTYRGQANDKCTLHILSLDLDFLDEVQAWIYDNAADTLSAGFSRGSMRRTDFSDKGRYSLSISCTQNKKGMAAKAALLDRFFTGGRVRKDMTLVQEKAHILAAIKEGKENASKMNYIISQHDNGLLYAYYLGTFWFWLADKRWVPSDFAKQEYEKAQKKNPRITPEEFMDSDDFIQMDDYEVPSQKLSALKALTPADSRMHAPDAEDVTDAPAASAEAREIVDECSEPDEECPYLQPLENSKKYNCQCSLCGDKFVNRDICNKSFRGCGWYQDQQEKDARHNDEEEIPATDPCQCRTCEHESCFAHGCTKECPSNAEESCLTTSCPEYREKPQVNANPTHAARNAQPCVPGASGVQPSPYRSADAGAKEDANDCKADGATSQNCPFYDVKEYSDNSEGHFCHLCGSLKRPHKVCLGKYKDDWHKCDVFIKYDGAEQLLNRNASSTLSATIQTTPTSVESSDIADDGIAMGRPCPGDVYRSPKSGQLYKIGELTNGKKTCYLTMRSNAQGGTWVPVNSSVYPKLSDAQGEFEAWIRTEQLEPAAPTGDAAATTVERAVKEQPRGVEISTTSESGADASTPLSESSSTQGPNSSPAPASRADAGAAEQSLSAAGPASLEAKDMNVPTFDYNGLDLPTRDTLRWAEKEIGEARRDYIARIAQAVSIAHDALCATVVQNLDNGKFTKSEESFQRWCESVGIKRSTAYNLLQVQALLSGATPDEQATLEAASPSLLYAAAKPSAPAELVQAVKDGDITTHKQYQEALAEIRARDAKINDLLEMSEAADRRAEEAERKRKEANEGYASAMETLRQAQEDAADADARARAAENRADGAEKLAELRGTENTELKAKIQEMENQPRDVAVIQPGEDQIEVWRQEGAERMAATMQETVSKVNQEKQRVQNQVIDLQKQLAASRPDADACQRTVDILYETTENLRLLLRSQLKQARLSPNAYGKVVAHVLQTARNLMDTVRVCSPDGYDMDSEEDDDFE